MEQSVNQHCQKTGNGGNHDGKRKALDPFLLILKKMTNQKKACHSHCPIKDDFRNNYAHNAKSRRIDQQHYGCQVKNQRRKPCAEHINQLPVPHKYFRKNHGKYRKNYHKRACPQPGNHLLIAALK